MKPVILIQRTPPGDAFLYSRYAGRECTNVVRLDSVPVGTVLPALSEDDVELLRDKPEMFFKEVA